MAHFAEAALIPLTNEPSKCSPAAERMRWHRERRREGLRCLTIELCKPMRVTISVRSSMSV